MSMEKRNSQGKRSFTEMREEQEEDEDTLEEEEALDKNQKGKVTSGSVICQVECCTADMSMAKPYNKRRRVCEFHAKAPLVPISGLYHRFCQQCSRFHELSEFDEAKRSCRRRLAGHNLRRRKFVTSKKK